MPTHSLKEEASFAAVVRHAIELRRAGHDY